MDSAIAVIIIVVAGYFVFTKLRNMRRGGCGGDCASGSCCQSNDGRCPDEEKGE